MTRWTNPQPGDNGKYAFVQSLPADAPPVLLRSFKPLTFDEQAGVFFVAIDALYRWQYWSASGWIEFTGQVSLCERPRDEEGKQSP